VAKKPSGKSAQKTVETIKHAADKRRNIPTAELQSVISVSDQAPRPVRYPRNTDLDPQLVWRGKDEQDWSDLVVQAPPLYIQEKVHPKVLIDDLLRQTREGKAPEPGQADLFGDFNGVPEGADKTEFYQHDQNWSNRMILGDSLQVMASLAEREGLRGKVQCIYFDPPYGIKFNSNFQWSTTSRDVKDGNAAHITREPEQVKAFRDTWRDGVHSYLTYLRDRLTVARDLLTESGSVFVQIGDENVHLVRALLEEVFGPDNLVAQVTIEKTSGQTQDYLSPVTDYVLWFSKSKAALKFRPALIPKQSGQSGFAEYSRLSLLDLSRRSMSLDERQSPQAIVEGARVYRQDNLTSQSLGREKGEGAASWFAVQVDGQAYHPSQTSRWKTNESGMRRLQSAMRVEPRGTSLSYVRFIDDFPAININNIWSDVKFSSRAEDKSYIVQTSARTIQRCVLMTTDPGDLVLDPTCGSGTTAFVAEQWGRRWITIDTSRVALALARARIMGARYPFYLLSDSRDGQQREAEVTRTVPSTQPVHGNIRHGFVYERVPHVTLKSIANNAEIDVIWEKWQGTLEPLREQLNTATRHSWQEWEIPREADEAWPAATKKLHADWWQARIARQKEIDASIAAKAEFEYLYDKPYVDNRKVRVAGPFTVESLSPHRMLGVDENDDLIDHVREDKAEYAAKQSFPEMILEQLKTAGVQQAHKEDRIAFISLVHWPGDLVCAEGRYLEGQGTGDRVQGTGTEKRAAIFIGPEFGTVQRADLVQAAREAADAGFDVLIACAFNYEAHTTEFNKLGRLPVLKARMNADLHMSEDLKNTGKGNLFVVFGEPDIEILIGSGGSGLTAQGSAGDDGRVRVRVKGVDVFKPQTGEVVSHGADGIACWFIDTDYNEESFFVRQAYFLGANDPYSALKTTLKSEIDADAWATLHSDTSRPFDKPKHGRIAVKVINHLGDEVMKVFRV
jgi:adenine-specific DNA-methyltransferase